MVLCVKLYRFFTKKVKTQLRICCCFCALSVVLAFPYVLQEFFATRKKFEFFRNEQKQRSN